MMTFLFWNVRKNPVQKIIADFAEMYRIDVIILAECDVEEPEMLNELNSRSESQYSFPVHRGRKIDIYTRFPSEWFTPVADIHGLSILHLENPVFKEDLLVVAVHLPSRLHQTEDDLSLLATRWRNRIEEAETAVGHTNTVVVGDLNMDPFHKGVVSSEGFHGITDKGIAKRRFRRVLEEDRHFFYNPMWSLLGDRSEGPPGTYYFNASSRPINFFWHMFDQVLLRPDLLPFFPDGELRILTQTNSDSLITDRGIPDATSMSDHLPLMFRLNIPVI